MHISRKTGKCVTDERVNSCGPQATFDERLGKCVTEHRPRPVPVKGCEEGFKLVDGKCVKMPKNKPQGCPAGTKPVPETDNCVKIAKEPKSCGSGLTLVKDKCVKIVKVKKDKNGFEIEPWKKPGCTGWKADCAKGNKSACSKYESTCQVN